MTFKEGQIVETSAGSAEIITVDKNSAVVRMTESTDYSGKILEYNLTDLKESVSKEAASKNIDSKTKRTKAEWEKIFKEWSAEMDKLYTNKKQRTDAAEWNDNPAHWMKPSSTAIYNAWEDYDSGGSPYTNKIYSKLPIKESVSKEGMEYANYTKLVSQVKSKKGFDTAVYYAVASHSGKLKFILGNYMKWKKPMTKDIFAELEKNNPNELKRFLAAFKHGASQGGYLESVSKEAVEKIACLECDAVSTAKAWKKNGGFCPKCKVSSRGVRESVSKEATKNDFKLGDKVSATIHGKKRQGKVTKNEKYTDVIEVDFGNGDIYGQMPNKLTKESVSKETIAEDEPQIYDDGKTFEMHYVLEPYKVIKKIEKITKKSVIKQKEGNNTILIIEKPTDKNAIKLLYHFFSISGWEKSDIIKESASKEAKLDGKDIKLGLSLINGIIKDMNETKKYLKDNNINASRTAMDASIKLSELKTKVTMYL